MSGLAPTPGPSRPRRDLALLVALCAVLFGAGLGAHDLWNPNEPIYGEAVKEMAARGTWSVPYVNDRVFGEKPILYYWMALASARVAGGVSETSLRIPAVVAGTTLVLGAYLLVLPYAGRRRAWLAAAATLTSYELWWVSRTVQMDVLVAASTLWVILLVTRVWDHGLSAWRGWTAAGAVAGLGFLAKGPVAWICPGLALAAYALATRRARHLVRPPMLGGLGACLVVATPWYIALWRGGHADVLHEVLIRQNFERFTNPWDHVAPFWYYLPYFIIDMAPWSFLVPIAWGLKRETENERRLARLAAVWIVTIVAFFSLSKSKRDPYIVPVTPAAAVLASEVLVAYVDGRLSRWRGAAVTAAAWALAALLAVAGAVVLARIVPRYPETALAARALVGTTSLAALAIAVAAWRARGGARRMLPVTLAVGTGAVYLVTALVVLPALDGFKSARPLCSRLAEFAAPGDRIASFDFWSWRAEYRYYLGRPIENLPGEAALREAWASPDRLVVLVERARLAEAQRVIGPAPPAFVGGVGSQTTYVFTNR